jgi:hypothetical protein
MPVGARFSALVQTDPAAHPASYVMGTGYFPGDTAAAAWRWPPTSPSTEVKKRVELYFYSPFGTTWPVLGWTLHYITLHYITLTRTGIYLTFRTALALLLSGRFINFEAQKPIIYFRRYHPEKKSFFVSFFQWRTGLQGQGRTDREDGTLLLYALYEDCCRRIDNTAPDHAFLFSTQIPDVHAL